MNVLTDIPFDKYDDVDYIYEYLNSHSTIGDEQNVEYNGIFHVHWRGTIDNDKVILQLKSILATQQVEKIFFWIENSFVTFMSPSYIKLNQFNKYIDVKVFDKTIISQVSGDPKNTEVIWNYYNRPHGNYRYKSDMLRWIILDIYGGVYKDVDNILLRDLTEVKLNNWSCKWPFQPYAEGSILKLEKGAKVYEQMYLNNPTNPKCFLMMFPPKFMLEAYNMKYDNLNFTVLPTPVSDIVFAASYQPPINKQIMTINNWDEFFTETDKDINIDNFFKGCIDYHWHNRYNVPELKRSPAGRLNAQFDEIIEAKYNIKPIKIFQG